VQQRQPPAPPLCPLPLSTTGLPLPPAACSFSLGPGEGREKWGKEGGGAGELAASPQERERRERRGAREERRERKEKKEKKEKKEWREEKGKKGKKWGKKGLRRGEWKP
jgi:hypothetical protein